MNKIIKEPIYVTRPSLPSLSDYVKEIRPIFETHLLTNSGPIHQKFQQQLQEYLGVQQLSLFVNGHMALELALKAIVESNGKNDGPGEVITTPFTFVSTTHAIIRNNLRPVFCDIQIKDYCLDPNQIEKLINDKTVAILPVHVYGNICDIKRIQAIADKYNLKVLYDGAHAFGEKIDGKGIGNFGDGTMFSFHATKVFNSIEGGAVTCQDSKLAELLNQLKNFGICKDSIVEVGPNAKMDEFRAAMGICNLNRIDSCIANRKAVHDRYVARLGSVPGIRLCSEQKGVEYNYAYFPVCFDESVLGYGRDAVCNALIAQNVFARKYFYPAINELPLYSSYNPNETPVAHEVSQRILTLPIYEGLLMEDVDRICDTILNTKGK